MIKIFQIITSVNLGGAENVVFNLVEQCSLLHGDKIEFVILELYPTNTYYAKRKKVELRLKGIQVISLSTGGKRASLRIAPINLFRILKQQKPQIVHSHTDLPDFVLGLVLKLAKFEDVRILRTIHNTELWSQHNRLGKFVESCYKDDYIIGVSKAALSAYLEVRKKNMLVVSSQTDVIYNACIPPLHQNHPFSINKAKINVAFCGRFVHQKGIDILVATIKTLNKNLNDKFLFHFVGSGPLLTLIEELQLTNDNVVIYNTENNLSSKLHDFDYLIVPSRFEGLGLISIEASLSGVPVIAARSPGLDETLPIKWPLLFDLESDHQLIQIFQNIADKVYNRKELLTLVHDYVTNKFSVKEMIDSYSDIYLNTHHHLIEINS